MNGTTLFNINFVAINFGDNIFGGINFGNNIFGGINFGEISTIH